MESGLERARGSVGTIQEAVAAAWREHLGVGWWQWRMRRVERIQRQLGNWNEWNLVRDESV